MKYLFAHFISDQGEGEQVYFSVSKDGLNWADLNNGEIVLRSSVGECGARDPFIVRDEETKKYYLIATDLRIASGKGWKVAQYEGSRDIIVWESTDLVNWTKERTVEIGIEGAGCVWAPESIYVPEKKAFFVFFASMTKSGEDEEYKQKIYSTWTKDFVTFTELELYIEKDNHVIDTTIISDKGVYYRFSKDETTKRIIMERGETLERNSFSKVDAPVLETLVGVEGPEIYKLEDKWCLIVDRFAEGLGYQPLIINNLESGDFEVLEKGKYDFGKNLKRHGGVIQITDEEYDRLKKVYGVN